MWFDNFNNKNVLLKIMFFENPSISKLKKNIWIHLKQYKFSSYIG